MKTNSDLKEQIKQDKSLFQSLIERHGKPIDKPFTCLVASEHKNGDKNPSMSYSEQYNILKCFANSNHNMDIFSFYAFQHHLDIKSDFPKIIKELAAEGGYSFQENDYKPKLPKKPATKSLIKEEKAKNIINVNHSNLISAKEKLKHWQKKGIEKDTLKRFQIGYYKGYGFENDVFPYYTAEGKLYAIKQVKREKIKNRASWKYVKENYYLTTEKVIPYNLHSTKDFNKYEPLYLTEGEKDTLRLIQEGFQALGIPSATGYNLGFNQYLEGFQTVIAIPDNDKAGMGLVKRMKDNGFKGKIAKWETLQDLWKGDSPVIKIDDGFDIVDLFRLENGKELFAELTGNAKSFSEIEKEEENKVFSRIDNINKILLIRIDSTKKAFEKREKIGEHIFSQLSKQGKFFFTNNLEFYFFYDKDKTLYQTGAKQFNLLLFQIFGITANDTEYKKIIDILEGNAYQKGTETEIYNVCFYNKEENVLYVFNNGHTIYRITPNAIEPVDNGTDGVLFLKNVSHSEFKVNPHKPLSDKEITDLLGIILKNPNYRQEESVLNQEESLFLFSSWFFSLFFFEIMPTRPILAFIGEKGSAKTFSLKLIKALFYGQKSMNIIRMPDSEKEADNFVINNYFWFFDNQDSQLKGRLSWTEDFLATLSTGNLVKRRELYTDKNELTFYPRGFPAITSRTPNFRRDDVSQRLLIIYLDPLEEDKIKSENELIGNFFEKRNDIWLAIMLYLKRILEALENGYKGKITHRMGDFQQFCFSMAKQEDNIEYVENLFQKMKNIQAKYTIEDNPIFEAIKEWIEKERPVKNLLSDETTNRGREVSSKELYRELLEINNDLPKTNKSFAQKLKNIKTELKEFFVIQEREVKRLKKYKFFQKSNSENSP